MRTTLRKVTIAAGESVEFGKLRYIRISTSGGSAILKNHLTDDDALGSTLTTAESPLEVPIDIQTPLYVTVKGGSGATVLVWVAEESSL